MLSTNEVKALQDKNLEIAKYFTTFCKENKIKCFFCGGACLGAIRHHGFIPWDDDIDLFMLASDFDELKRVWKEKADTEHYSLCYETKTYNDHHLTPTIRDNYTTFITEETKDRDVNQGVALEIAILNVAPESKIGQKVQLAFAALASLYKAQRLPNRQKKSIYMISKALLKIVPSETLRYYIWNWAEKIATLSNKKFGKNKYVREFTMFPFIKWLYPCEWFKEVYYADFEDTKMPIPIGYKEYLTKRYGNYMEFPPEKDRHPEHRIVFMDLDNSYLKYKGIYYYKINKNKINK